MSSVFQCNAMCQFRLSKVDHLTYKVEKSTFILMVGSNCTLWNKLHRLISLRLIYKGVLGDETYDERVSFNEYSHVSSAESYLSNKLKNQT